MAFGTLDPYENLDDEAWNSQLRETSRPVTSAESAEAAAELSINQTPTQALLRMKEISDAKDLGGKIYSGSELNELFETDIFKESMNLQAATLIDERHKEEARLQEVINQGPQGPYQSAKNFFYEVGVQAVDPVNIASGVAIGGLRAALAAKGLLTKLPFLASEAPTAAQAFGRNVVEGLVGNAAVEPINIAARDQEQRDFQAAESLLNITTGAVGFAGLAYAGGKLKALPRALKNKIEDRAIKQIASGESVQVDGLIRAEDPKLGNVDAPQPPVDSPNQAPTPDVLPETKVLPEEKLGAPETPRADDIPVENKLSENEKEFLGPTDEEINSYNDLSERANNYKQDFQEEIVALDEEYAALDKQGLLTERKKNAFLEAKEAIKEEALFQKISNLVVPCMGRNVGK